MAVSMQTPLPSYGNFGQTISNSINQAAGRVHDAKMQQERINSTEKMHADTLAHNERVHNMDTKIKIGVATGDMSGMGLESDLGFDWVNQANANIKSNPNASENYNNLSVSNNYRTLDKTIEGDAYGRGVGKEDETTKALNAKIGTIREIKKRPQDREDWMNMMREDTGYGERFFSGLGWRIMNPTKGWFDGKTHYQSMLDEMYDKGHYRDDMTILEDEYAERGLDPENMSFPETALLNTNVQKNTLDPSTNTEVMNMINDMQFNSGKVGEQDLFNLLRMVQNPYGR